MIMDLLLCSFILLFPVIPASGNFIQKFTGDTVHIPVETRCAARQTTRLLHVRKGASAHLVATLDGVWKPGPGYEDRLDRNGSVVLKSANINDNGVYELTCGDNVVAHTQLSVRVLIELPVPEGKPVKVPCFFVTAGEPVEYVQWEKDGKLVLRMTDSGGITRGAESEGVSVSPDWIRLGDLSLIIPRVRLTHSGVYTCTVHTRGEEKTKRGNPEAVKLNVTQRTADLQVPVHTPPPVRRPTQCPTWTWTPVIITAAVTSVLIAPSAILVFWFLKNRRCCGRHRKGEEEKEEEEEERRVEGDGEAMRHNQQNTEMLRLNGHKSPAIIL
ncbi:uncharacterized protein LOC108902084 [Lates calcarifer]|uniref:Uncharacterized protein LOC108902084 n=1 Tax=Lates calcarifer TaxID=8187 RepID=A0AAJ7QLL9_LATCA|nr:uncharacterized protein LOC108902084 [Lates calcarifer]